MTKTTLETISHAEANAKAWAERIATAYEAYEFCTEGGKGRDLSREAKALLHELKYDGKNQDAVAEEIEQQTRDRALSVTVRSGWQLPTEHMDPIDFQILLTCGGPALRIMGELDGNDSPNRCWIEHQDWGTPWIIWPDVDADALDWFSTCFGTAIIDAYKVIC